MAEIKAFRGLRFTDKAGSTGEVCCPPYDIISHEQKKQYLAENPHNIIARCKKNGTKVIFSHVNEQPMAVMKKDEFVDKIGEDNFCKNIDEALARANQLEKEFHLDRKKKKNFE